MPEGAADLIEKAAEFRGMRRFDRALTSSNEAIRLYGNSAQLLTERAITYFVINDYSKAAADAKAALELDSTSVKALLYLALSSGKAGNVKEALSAYDKLLQLDPEYGITYTNRGLLNEELGRTSEALLDYDHAIRLNAADHKAHYNRANLLYELKRYDECFAAYGCAIAANPVYVMAYGNRGTTYLELERYPEAIRDFTEAIRCEPRATLPLVNRGGAQWMNGCPVEGYADLRRAIDISPFNPWPLSIMADLLEREGRWPEALEYFDKAASLLDRTAARRARELRAKLGGEQASDMVEKAEAAFPLRSGDQWLDTLAFWLHRIEENPAEASGEALWKGTPFPEILAAVRSATVGRDANALRALGDAAFRTARTAHRNKRSRTAIQALYEASAYFALGADLDNLATSLTNLGVMFADLRHVDKAIRVERYALTLKEIIGSRRESISRCLLVIAQMEEVSGNYVKARDLYENATGRYADSDVEQIARTPDDNIERLDTIVYVSYESIRSELEPPIARSSSDWMAEAASFLVSKPRSAAMSMHQAVEAARRAGNVTEEMSARFVIGNLLYNRFAMFHEAYRHFAGAAVLAARLKDTETECEARLLQSRAAAEGGDFGTARELLLLALSRLSNAGPSRLRADVLSMLSLVSQELELKDESAGYLEMALREAESFPATEETHEWFVREGQRFRTADLNFAALSVWVKGIMHAPRLALREQLELSERVARLYYEMRDWRAVISFLEITISCAEALGDVPVLARSWTHLGMAALELEDYDLAEHAKGMAEAQPVKTEDNAAQSDLMSLSMQLFSIGQSKVITDLDPKMIAAVNPAHPAVSRDILRTKIDRLLQSGQPDPVQLAESYCAIATLTERSGRTGWAFAELFEGLRTLRRLKLHRWRADLLQVYATILMRHRRMRAAWRALRAAVGVCGRFDPDRNLGPLLALIGECRLSLSSGNGVGELINALEQAGDFATQWGSPEGLLVLSRLHQQWGSAESAAGFAEALIERTSAEPESERHIRSLAWAASNRVRQHRLDEAEDLAKRVLEVAEVKRASELEYDQLDWRRDCIQASGALLAVWYERSGDNAARALAMTERVRVRSLLERFGRNLLNTPESLPDDLKREERLLLGIDRMKTQYHPRLDPDMRRKVAMVDDDRKLEEFWANLPEPWRAYGQLRLGQPRDPQAILRTSLGASPAHFLEIFPTEFGTYVWHLKSDGSIVSWRRAQATLSDLQDFCYRFRAAMAANAPRPAGSRKLTMDLLGPDLEEVPADEIICLVPSGPLLQLPFGALPLDQGYLIERNPIAILPALSLLAYRNDRGAHQPRNRALVVGDSLGDLSGALKEAAIVGALLKTEWLVGDTVQRSTIATALRDCGFLHVACHAFYDERDPAGSGFWLADRSVFSARDFTESDLRVRLAVLSACESGRLDVAAGDELAGIPSSLLLCGASAVVSALWRIPDEHTLELMKLFYESLIVGKQDMARALAEAQRDLLKHASPQRPCQWAAFQLFGLWMTDWNIAEA